MAALVVIVLAAAVQLAQVDNQLDLGNGDYYLRNAATYARGSLAHSRYSPGIGLFLAPIARIAGSDYHLLTFLAEMTMVAVTTCALIVLCRLLRIYVAPWPAVIVLAAFAVGQSAAVFLTGAQAEPLSLLLVTGCLLALARDRSWWAVALGVLAVGVRVALAPFVGVLFLVLLLRHRRSAVVGVAAMLAAVAAHFGSGPTVDQSYLRIGTAVYDREGAGGGVGVARAALARADDYLRFGIPRLVTPFRLLASPVGWALAALVLSATVAGILRLRRARRDSGPSPEARAFDAACLAALAYLGVLLFWPIRAGESTRLLIPIVVVPLAGLGSLLETVLRGGATSRPVRLGTAALALLLVANVGSTPLALAERRRTDQTESRFIAVHERASRLAWDGPVVSRKPAFTELTTQRRSYAYPVGYSAEELEDLSRRAVACTFIVDEMLGGMPESAAEWVDSRQDTLIAADRGTRIVTIRAPWCERTG